MTRKIIIGSALEKVEVSKNEAREVERLMLFTTADRQLQFDKWLQGCPSPEARMRRINVGKALRLKVPE